MRCPKSQYCKQCCELLDVQAGVDVVTHSLGDVCFFYKCIKRMAGDDLIPVCQSVYVADMMRERTTSQSTGNTSQ